MSDKNNLTPKMFFFLGGKLGDFTYTRYFMTPFSQCNFFLLLLNIFKNERTWLNVVLKTINLIEENLIQFTN